MGTGASAEESSKAIQGASAEELQTALKEMPEEARSKIKNALSTAQDAGGENPYAAYEKFFTHKGPFDKEKAGPAPDYTKPEAWYWYGDDGTTGPELLAEGAEKPPAADRAADCFYIHPTSYYGDSWNMPLSEACADDVTTVYLASEASAFNASCRIYAPRYRQCTCASFGIAEEGRQAMEVAFTDLKAAFEHYLKDRNDGRPLVLASHSQGSLNMTRLLQECVEGKEVMKQVVGIYCLGAWVPLDMFEGETAVFKDIKLCKAPDSVGCFMHWNLDSAARAEQRRSDGKWDVQIGQWRTGEWTPIDGLAVVGTNPLTWSSNGMGGVSEPAEQQGVKLVAETTDGPLTDMNDLGMVAMKDKNVDLKVKSMAKFGQTELQALLDKEEKGTFSVKVDDKTGDVVTPLPAECGDPTAGYEAMNFLLFYFNIRDNVRTRLDAFKKQ